MTLNKTVLSLAVLLLASAPMVRAQGTYTQIDYPGAVSTAAEGIDQAGDVSGFYEDASDVFHGFLLSGGVYTTIDYPGATQTYIYGINNQGTQIVGSTVFQAFVYDIQSQAFTDIAYPGGNSTLPLAVNDSGSVAGTFQDPKNGIVYGFELVDSSYHRISLPNTSSGVWAGGITNSNEVVGGETNPHANFLVRPGKKPRIILTSLTGEPEAFGISPSGNVVVGAYYPVEQAEGFTYSHGRIQTIVFGGGDTTFAYGTNASGEVVGVFVDQSNNTHGFTWTPPAAASEKK